MRNYLRDLQFGKGRPFCKTGIIHPVESSFPHSFSPHLTHLTHSTYFYQTGQLEGRNME